MTIDTRLAPSPDVHAPVRARRQRRLRGLSRRRDALQAIVWLFMCATLSFFLATGPEVVDGIGAALSSTGRFLGLIATVLLLVQVMLAARAPVVERVIGHDRALAIHGSIGQPALLLLLGHAVFLTVGWAWLLDRGVVTQFLAYFSETRWIALGVIGLALLVIVAGTSIAAVRRRWSYEVWHVIHVAAYLGIALSVPHQFLDGTTFRSSSAAAWMWAGAYVVAFGSLLVWRVAVPVARAWRHRLVVTEVRRDDDGTITITMVGRALESLDAQPGQFLLWRFWTWHLWANAHPYSLSAAPDGRSLRITVASLGDDSARLRGISPGTRVSVAGPYGIFTHEARTATHLVLVAAGVGVTPIRALLDDPEVQVGDCDIVLRARSAREMPLLDEVADLAAQRGARLHVLWGHRGESWTPDGMQVTLADLVPSLPDADIFICGPAAWARAVERDASDAGVPRHALHREEFGW